MNSTRGRSCELLHSLVSSVCPDISLLETHGLLVVTSITYVVDVFFMKIEPHRVFAEDAEGISIGRRRVKNALLSHQMFSTDPYSYFEKGR